jgi:hypothetical protein
MSGTHESSSVLPTVHALDFHGDQVLLVDVDGRPHVVLRPALEALGLAYWPQLEKLRDRSWATVTSRETVAADGRVRQMVTVDVRTFLMLLATIDERRVAETVRPKLVAYQAEVADAIEAYWTKGAAINPRATPEQITTALHEHHLRCLAIAREANLVDPAWLEAKTRHVLARTLGEEPEVDPTRRPLTVSEYLDEKGIRGRHLRTLAPEFGKWLKSEYITEFGCPPPIVERFVDNALRRVCGYTEAHRPLFDAVWSARIGAGDDDDRVIDAPVVRLPDAMRGRRGWRA